MILDPEDRIPPMANTTVGIGTKFHSSYADSNPEWEVVSKSGRGVWKCKVTDSLDYAGVVKHFSSDEIKRSLAVMAAFDAAKNGTNDYYSQLPLGTIVHYCNGGGEYVRCEVVMGVTVHSEGQRVKCLKKLALVGSWRAYDLPRRERDGSIYLGYQAESIQSGECFKPSAGCVFESPSYRRMSGEPDPAKMSPLSLEVPPMDESAERLANLEKIRQSVASVLDNFSSDPAKALRAVKEILAGVSV